MLKSFKGVTNYTSLPGLNYSPRKVLSSVGALAKKEVAYKPAFAPGNRFREKKEKDNSAVFCNGND